MTRAGRPSPEPNATLIARRALTDRLVELRVLADRPVDEVRPGQYLTLGLSVDGRYVPRPYSSVSFGENVAELDFLVRRVAGGALTPRLFELAPGDRVTIGRPKGLFALIPGDQRTHLLVSSGSGIAPLVPMASTLHADPSRPRVVVLHGVSYVAELAYRARFEAWAAGGLIEYFPTISRPSDPVNRGWSGAHGRAEDLIGAICSARAIDPRRGVVYACGNPSMLAAVGTTLTRLGFAPEDIRSEEYWRDERPSRAEAPEGWQLGSDRPLHR